MNEKFLRTRNGKWISLSMSVLAAALVLANQQDIVSADQVITDPTTTQPESSDIVEENTENQVITNNEVSGEMVEDTETTDAILETQIEDDSEALEVDEVIETDQTLEEPQVLSSPTEEVVETVAEEPVQDQTDAVEQAETITNPLNTHTPEEFINKFGESARKIAEDNDLYASVMLAQAALESGWGNSELAQSPSNNLFGIKGEYQGSSRNIETMEDDGTGTLSQIEADFRSYDNYDDSLNDYARFLTGKDASWRESFYEGARRSVAQSYEDATAHLTGRYATDIHYADRLNRIISEYNLTQFDTPSLGNAQVATREVAAPQVAVQQASTQQVDAQQVDTEQIAVRSAARSVSSVPTVSVKSGDTLYSIATKNNMTVNQLRQLNNLSGNVIHPGQKLVLSPNTTASNANTNGNTSANNTNTSVTVKSGDTLYRIAMNHNITVEQLRRYNNLSGNVIRPGQQLKVKPDQTVTKPAEKPQETVRPNNPTTSTNTITVQRGDTLYRLALQNNMTVNELRQLNQLSGNIIVPGQTLKVKGHQSASKPAEKPADTNKPNNSRPDTVTVKSGDSLYRIASANNMTVEQLRLLNNITGDIIHPGQQLKLKGTTNTPAKPAEKPTVKPSTPIANSYTVRNGDTLYKIATANGMTVNQLKELNNLTSNIIVTGQKLNLTRNSNTNTNTPQTNVPTYTGNNLPDLTNAQSAIVNYDVKLNGKVEPFRTTLSTSGTPVSVLKHFGQKYTVTREFTQGGNKFLELSRDGVIQGYVPASAAVQVPQNVRTVYLDAGHGGSESGAHSFGTAEKDLNMAISNRLADLLRGKGYHVYETRRTDKTVSLHDRSKATNEIMPDIFVSIHHNAMANPGSARGIEVLYHDPRIDEPNYTTMEHHKGTNIIPEGRRLAQSLQTGLVNATQGINRGIRPQNLHVTRVTDVPAALVELGFQDNWHDYQLLTNKTYQNKLVQGLINGIDAYFAGIK